MQGTSRGCTKTAGGSEGPTQLHGLTRRHVDEPLVIPRDAIGEAAAALHRLRAFDLVGHLLGGLRKVDVDPGSGAHTTGDTVGGEDGFDDGEHIVAEGSGLSAHQLTHFIQAGATV